VRRTVDLRFVSSPTSSSPRHLPPLPVDGGASTFSRPLSSSLSAPHSLASVPFTTASYASLPGASTSGTGWQASSVYDGESALLPSSEASPATARGWSTDVRERLRLDTRLPSSSSTPPFSPLRPSLASRGTSQTLSPLAAVAREMARTPLPLPVAADGPSPATAASSSSAGLASSWSLRNPALALPPSRRTHASPLSSFAHTAPASASSSSSSSSSSTLTSPGGHRRAPSSIFSEALGTTSASASQLGLGDLSIESAAPHGAGASSASALHLAGAMRQQQQTQTQTQQQTQTRAGGGAGSEVPASSAGVQLQFNPTNTAPVFYGSTLALETLDGWYLTVHPRTGLTAVREPEPNWYARGLMPFQRTYLGRGQYREAPHYLFKVVNLVDPMANGPVRAGDPVWLQATEGRGEPSWKNGSVLCPHVHRAIELDASAVDADGNPLKTFEPHILEAVERGALGGGGGGGGGGGAGSGSTTGGAAPGSSSASGGARRAGSNPRGKGGASNSSFGLPVGTSVDPLGGGAGTGAASSTASAFSSSSVSGVTPGSDLALAMARVVGVGDVHLSPLARRDARFVKVDDGLVGVAAYEAGRRGAADAAAAAAADGAGGSGGGGGGGGSSAADEDIESGPRRRKEQSVQEFVDSLRRQAEDRARPNPLDRVGQRLGVIKPTPAHVPNFGSRDDYLYGPATGLNATGQYFRRDPGYEVLYEMANARLATVARWKLQIAQKEITEDGMLIGGLGIEPTGPRGGVVLGLPAGHEPKLRRGRRDKHGGGMMSVAGAAAAGDSQARAIAVGAVAVDPFAMSVGIDGDEEEDARRKRITGEGARPSELEPPRDVLFNMGLVYIEQDWFYVAYAPGVPGTAPGTTNEAEGSGGDGGKEGAAAAGGGAGADNTEGGSSGAGAGAATAATTTKMTSSSPAAPGTVELPPDSAFFGRQPDDGVCGGNKRESFLQPHSAGVSGPFKVERRGVFRIRVLQAGDTGTSSGGSSSGGGARGEGGGAGAGSGDAGGAGDGADTQRSPKPRRVPKVTSDDTVALQARTQLRRTEKQRLGAAATGAANIGDDELRARVRPSRDDDTAAENLARSARSHRVAAQARADGDYLSHEAAKFAAPEQYFTARIGEGFGELQREAQTLRLVARNAAASASALLSTSARAHGQRDLVLFDDLEQHLVRSGGSVASLPPSLVTSLEALSFARENGVSHRRNGAQASRRGPGTTAVDVATGPGTFLGGDSGLVAGASSGGSGVGSGVVGAGSSRGLGPGGGGTASTAAPVGPATEPCRLCLGPGGEPVFHVDICTTSHAVESAVADELAAAAAAAEARRQSILSHPNGAVAQQQQQQQQPLSIAVPPPSAGLDAGAGFGFGTSRSGAETSPYTAAHGSGSSSVVASPFSSASSDGRPPSVHGAGMALMAMRRMAGAVDKANGGVHIPSSFRFTRAEAFAHAMEGEDDELSVPELLKGAAAGLSLSAALKDAIMEELSTAERWSAKNRESATGASSVGAGPLTGLFSIPEVREALQAGGHVVPGGRGGRSVSPTPRE
jgi:hypothetical protein